ncbi:MAG: transcription antitermination factor NusB [Christensenellaceae bacterium]|jgi:N utilization substance protein B|nr:transcription antitermination factor NusB [Christensenellaceae bacterium]
MGRRSEREVAFRLIFERLFNEGADFLTGVKLLEEEDNAKYDSGFAKEVLEGVTQNLGVIEQQIKDNLVGYKFERIYKIDLSLLILAIYEIKYQNTDPKIVINEVVELGKKFSTDKSPAFINGILSKIING